MKKITGTQLVLGGLLLYLLLRPKTKPAALPPIKPAPLPYTKLDTGTGGAPALAGPSWEVLCYHDVV